MGLDTAAGSGLDLGEDEDGKLHRIYVIKIKRGPKNPRLIFLFGSDILKKQHKKMSRPITLQRKPPMLKVFGFVTAFVTGIACASTIYVTSPIPQVQASIQQLVIERGGSLSPTWQSDYAITVMPHFRRNYSSGFNSVGSAPGETLTVVFTNQGNWVDDFIVTVGDESDQSALQALSPYMSKISRWIQSTQPEVPAQVSYTSPIPQAALPQIQPQKNPTNFSPPLPQSSGETPSPAVSQDNTPISQNFTGLIVDTSGFKVSRGMSPKIFDDTGRLIYGWVSDADVDKAVAVGLVGYVKNYDAALYDKRAGSHPMLVHIVNINANPENFFPKEVVVSKADADRILEANSHTHFLENYNVIFIVDPKNL